MELTNRRDFRIERAMRKRGPAVLRHFVGKLEQPESVIGQAVAAAAVAARRHPRVAACLIAAPLIALATTTLIKHATVRPRPLSHLLRRKGLQSFPSSHTAGKSALVWMLALAFPAPRRTRLLAAAIASLDVAAVALARIGDGAHWPTDTLGGAAIGLASAELVARLGGCPRSD